MGEENLQEMDGVLKQPLETKSKYYSRIWLKKEVEFITGRLDLTAPW